MSFGKRVFFGLVVIVGCTPAQLRCHEDAKRNFERAIDECYERGLRAQDCPEYRRAVRELEKQDWRCFDADGKPVDE